MTCDSGVYTIMQLSKGLHYVGSAVSLGGRWSRHKSDLRAGIHHNQKLQRAWNKYGESDFQFSVIETCDRDVLIEREQFWLDETLPFFNILRRAYSAAGYKHTDEAKAKNSEKTRAFLRSLTDEEREKRAREHAEKIRGKRHSESTKAKMSESHKGKQMTPAQLANLELRATPEAIRKNALVRSKTYIVTKPDGEELVVRNLSEFCRKNSLSQGHMNSTATGRRPHHRGWRCRPHEEGVSLPEGGNEVISAMFNQR